MKVSSIYQSSNVFFGLFVFTYLFAAPLCLQDLSSRPGTEPRPWRWKSRTLTTRIPGNYQQWFKKIYTTIIGREHEEIGTLIHCSIYFKLVIFLIGNLASVFQHLKDSFFLKYYFTILYFQKELKKYIHIWTYICFKYKYIPCWLRQ